LLLWDAKTGKDIRRFEGTPIWPDSLAFSPDCRRALSNGTNDGSFLVWNVDSGKLLLTLKGHTKRVNSVAYSPDGEYALTASSDKTLRLWRLPKPASARK
jgi:WD40 repeat protein